MRCTKAQDLLVKPRSREHFRLAHSYDYQGHTVTCQHYSTDTGNRVTAALVFL